MRCSILVLALATATSLTAAEHAIPGAGAPKAGEPDTLWVGVFPEWGIGDRWRIEVVQGERKFIDGVLVSSDSSMTSYTKAVSDIDEYGYLVQWHIDSHETTSEHDTEWMETIDEALYHRIASEGFELRIDDWGELVALENRDVYHRVMEHAMDQLLAEGDASDAGPNIRAAFEFLGGPEWLLGKLIEPIEMFYHLGGVEWAVGVEDAYDDALLFGTGDLVPALTKVKIHQLDQKAQTLVLTKSTAIDRDKLAEALVDFYSAAGADARAATAAIESGVNMRDESRFTVDVARGIVIELDWRRHVTAGASRNEVFLRIRATPL